MNRQDLPADADGDAMWRVISHGSDVRRPMVVDFMVAAPNEESGLEFVRALPDGEFEVHLSRDESSGRWTVYCAKHMVLDHSILIAIQNRLHAIGKRSGCYSDGWGTFGNKDE